MSRGLLMVIALLVPIAAPPASGAAGLVPVSDVEITHALPAHEAHMSAPAVAVTPDGTPLIAWFVEEKGSNNAYVARVGPTGVEAPVRVNRDGLTVDAVHQSPGLAVGPDGTVYVSWSSRKSKPETVLFASDLQLSRSLDGGRLFEPALRVNADRMIAHSFEGLAVAADGTVLLAWVDAREGETKPRTFLARIIERGTRVEREVKLDAEETCVCCRVAVNAGPRNTVAALWRKVFPGSVRDMVVGVSGDGGRTFAGASLVHADGWNITACPHRGGRLGVDARGHLYAAWYTEGRREVPQVLFATSADGRRFADPRRLDVSSGSIPDHVRLAVTPDGIALAAWEDATAARRRVVLRDVGGAGRALGSVRVVSAAVKAYAPDVASTPGGEFVVAWHEERFPFVRTVVRVYRVKGAR